MKQLVRDLTPPVLWRAAKRISQMNQPGGFAGSELGSERSAEFYDQTFDRMTHWKSHYTASHYYPLWTIVADRIRQRGCKNILDIGCGPGQIACLMRDTPGIKSYLGLDFSSKRIAQAKDVCPEFEFQEVDVFESDIFDERQYDAVLVMEFLEHVERDLFVLERLRKGSYLLATVPNFPAPGHVRYFSNAEEVQRRYGDHVDSIRVDTIVANDQGKEFYIFDGFIP